MSFLASIAAYLLEWLLAKLGALIGAFYKKEQQDAAIVKQAQDDVDKLKQAQTDEDKDNAAQSIIDHTFS